MGYSENQYTGINKKKRKKNQKRKEVYFYL